MGFFYEDNEIRRQIEALEKKQKLMRAIEDKHQRQEKKQYTIEYAIEAAKEAPTVITGDVIQMGALGRQVVNEDYVDLLEPVLKSIPVDVRVEITIKVVGPLE